MALLDKNSRPSAQSELMLFKVPATQVAIQKSTQVTYNPKNSIETFPIIFDIPSQPQFVDFARSNLFCKFKITKADGTPAEVGKAAPINYIGATFFSQVKFYAGNRLVYDSHDHLHYKSIIEAVLGETKDKKESILRSALWGEDSAGEKSEAVPENAGMVKRRDTAGTEFETVSKIHCELFNQDQYLPNNCQYRIELFRNSNDLVMMAKEGSYKIQLTQCQFMVRMVETVPSFTLAFEKHLAKTPAKYSFRKVIPLRTLKKLSSVSVLKLSSVSGRYQDHPHG